MILKRITAIITSLLLALSATSCSFVIINDMSNVNSGVTDKDSSDTPSDSEKNNNVDGDGLSKYTPDVDNKALAEEYLSELPERDFDGTVFFITTTDKGYIAPEDTNNAVSRLAMVRNSEVEDMLNITIRVSVASHETMLSEMKNAIAADSYYTDLLMLPIYTIGAYKSADTLMNMRSLPFFNIDEPYFYSDSSDMTSGSRGTYGVAGQASISPSSFSAVYMNKNILSVAGFDSDDIYKMASDGTWTWDEYLKITSAVNDINADGTVHYYTTTAEGSTSRFADLVFKSSGNDFVSSNVRSMPTIGFSVKSTAKTMETLYTIYNDSNKILDSSAGAVNIFSKGESAFLIEYLSVMPKIVNAKNDWGIVPLPKGEEQDEYRTLIANTEAVFAVPKNHTKGEIAGITLSYLNAASYGYIYDEYVNYSMLHYLRDNDSVKMLDIMLDTPAFDFALAFGNAYPEIANATYRLIRETARSNNLEEYFEARRKEANRVMSKNFNLIY